MIRNILCGMCFCFGLCLAGAEADHWIWNLAGLGIFSGISIFKPKGELNHGKAKN